MRAARADANQPEIVKALRDIGCTVESLHRVGKGVPDLLVGFKGRNFLIEVKDGSKVPSKQKLNDDQVEWRAKWTGQVAVANSVKAAIEVIEEDRCVKD